MSFLFLVSCALFFFRRILSLATISCCMHVFCYIFSFASYVHAFLLVWESGHHYLLYASVFVIHFCCCTHGFVGWFSHLVSTHTLNNYSQQIISTVDPSSKYQKSISTDDLSNRAEHFNSRSQQMSSIIHHGSQQITPTADLA